MLRNFNKIFRKDVTYNNMRSQNKLRLYSLFRQYNFQKTTNGDQIDPSPLARVILGLMLKLYVISKFQMMMFFKSLNF